VPTSDSAAAAVSDNGEVDVHSHRSSTVHSHHRLKLGCKEDPTLFLPKTIFLNRVEEWQITNINIP
jgi:hypothetical protein